MAELLLKAGAAVNQLCANSTAPRQAGMLAGDLLRRTPLHAAVERDDKKMAAFLLDSAADPNVQSTVGVTALAMAARYGLVDMTELLLARGAKIRVERDPTYSELFKPISAIEHLLVTDRTSDSSRFLGLTQVTITQELSILQLLLASHNSSGSKIPAKTLVHAVGLTPTSRADQLALILLNHAPTKGLDFNLIASRAVKAGLGGCVARLLELQPSIATATATSEVPLLVEAVVNNRTDIGLLLLNAGADVNVGGPKNPLVYACSKGYYEFAKALAEAGADVNYVGAMTPLMYSVASGSEKTARLLLRHKADPYLNSTEGFCAVDLARSGSELATRLFFSKPVVDVVVTPDKPLPMVYGLLPPVLIFLLWRWHQRITRARYKKLLRTVYTKHAPEKLKDIDMILDAYAGKETELEEALNNTYKKTHEMACQATPAIALDSPRRKKDQ